MGRGQKEVGNFDVASGLLVGVGDVHGSEACQAGHADQELCLFGPVTIPDSQSLQPLQILQASNATCAQVPDSGVTGRMLISMHVCPNHSRMIILSCKTV